MAVKMLRTGQKIYDTDLVYLSMAWDKYSAFLGLALRSPIEPEHAIVLMGCFSGNDVEISYIT